MAHMKFYPNEIGWALLAPIYTLLRAAGETTERKASGLCRREARLLHAWKEEEEKEAFLLLFLLLQLLLLLLLLSRQRRRARRPPPKGRSISCKTNERSKRRSPFGGCQDPRRKKVIRGGLMGFASCCRLLGCLSFGLSLRRSVQAATLGITASCLSMTG